MDPLAWDHLRELLDACRLTPLRNIRTADVHKEHLSARSYAGFVAEHPRLLIASSTACFISASKYGFPTSSRASPHHSWVVVSLVIFTGFGGGSYKVHPVNANALISATSAGIAPARVAFRDLELKENRIDTRICDLMGKPLPRGGPETANKRQTKIPVTALSASQIVRKLIFIHRLI
jgi:hypothetical protein